MHVFLPHKGLQKQCCTINIELSNKNVVESKNYCVDIYIIDVIFKAIPLIISTLPAVHYNSYKHLKY